MIGVVARGLLEEAWVVEEKSLLVHRLMGDWIAQDRLESHWVLAEIQGIPA
jgi:hypothetical protein